MPDSINKVLENGYRLRNEGKTDEALQLINDFQEKMSLNPTEELRLKLFKGFTKLYLEDFEKALSIGEQLYQESQKLDKPLLSIESIFIKFLALFFLWRPWEFSKDLEKCGILLQSSVQEPSSEFEAGEAKVFFIKGFFHFWESNYDLAIEHQKESILTFEQDINLAEYVPWSLWVIGISHASKGELDEALNSFLRSLDLSKGQNFMSKAFIAANFNGIGLSYYQQGKLDLAIEYLEKSLQRFETKNIPLFVLEVGWRYNYLIKIALDKKSLEQAQEYLRRYSQYLENNKISEDYFWYLLSKAQILRTSTRTRERAEAEKILLQLIERYGIVIRKGKRGTPEESTPPIIEICDLYLEELRLTNDLGILEDIQPLINRLLKEAKRTKSYSLHSQTLLLLGKISLLQMNMGDARRHLTQAQQIAESHGLQLLARAISSEHDRLLEQLHKWEILEQNKAPISERMDLASLDDTIDSMQGKRAVWPPEPVDEQSILLMIIAEGGVLIFSYPFSEEWKFDDELFGGFLTAFNSISNEIFSEGLDRVKFGKQTVLMENVANFSICYLFKGQTYPAKQKFDEFIERIQEFTSIFQTLEKYYKTSQVVELADIPLLEPLILEIFSSKKPN